MVRGIYTRGCRTGRAVSAGINRPAIRYTGVKLQSYRARHKAYAAKTARFSGFALCSRI
jgi:hypothetical protein